MTNIGTLVTVRGDAYRVIDKRSASSAGSKFFGKWVFTLANANGEKFTVFGKTVVHNSRLTPL